MSDQKTGEIRTKKSEEKPPKTAREKRSRMALVALTAGFGILMVIQGPTLLSAISGGGDSAVESGTASADVAGGGAAANPTALEGEVAAGAVSPPSELTDSDLPQRAGVDELSKIDNFDNGDPFVALVEPAETTETTSSSDGAADDAGATDVESGTTAANDAPTGDSESEGSPSVAPSPGSSSGEAESSGTDTGSETVAITGARVSINNVTQVVEIGDSFPKSDPVFVVTEVKAGVLSVGLVEGAFSTGTESIGIELGETRGLVSQPSGVRYSVRFDKPISN